MSDGEYENEGNPNHAVPLEHNVHNNDPLGGFPRLRAFIANDENNEIKQTSVDVNNCEILLAVLKYALTYSLSQTAVADLFKLICVLMGCDDLPTSRYLIDKLFNNTDGVVYHACCPECKKYVSTFDQSTKTLTCPRCNFLVDVRSPTYNEFFAIIDPRFEIANLLEINWEEYQKILRKDRVNGTYSDFTDGEMYKAIIDSLPIDVRLRFITLLFNADGAALFKSSNFSVWPIQAIVNELPYRVRTAAPVTCGIWFGKDKPDMQIFLKEFVFNMNRLSIEGIPCKVGDDIINVKVYCPCGCVDSMARGPMQALKLCTGYFGCNWCLHPGVYVTPQAGKKGAIKYVVMNDIEDRTETETKEQMRQAAASTEDVCGVKNASWLIHLFYFNIIWGFVPDPMHHVDLGLGKQFLERWLIILTPNQRSRIDSFMKKIKVPNSVQRLSRPIKDRKFWKAQEWENFILYYSLPILRAFPHMAQIADHWALLVEGSVAMRQSEVILRRHVASMDSSSVIDYVNYLDYSGAKNTTKLTNERYFGNYKVSSLRKRSRMGLSQDARIYRKMVKGGCLYRSMHNKSVRSDDSYAKLNDGTYIHIVEFVVDECQDRSTTVCNFLQVQPFINRDLATVGIVSENHVSAHIDTRNIETVCVAVQIDDSVYLTPPPNLYRCGDFADTEGIANFNIQSHTVNVDRFSRRLRVTEDANFQPTSLKKEYW
ncbi:hypothetical protein QAD02_013483 [Eretmocerus hayati]|uniref:Uncharacterized protein n=1 Tax=Eretmocerus hayati TaxID=131215 RepID=A0ACC2P4E8_9HYME|nr:hypothetical protein QAD02_013483 [Eretmocerus hayati]